MTTGGGRRGRVLPFRPPRLTPRGDAVPEGTGRLGMALLLVSLSILFAASIAVFVLTRARLEAWPPPDTPGLPRGLWVATFVLVASSGTMHRALAAIRRDDPARSARWLLVTIGAGVVFLGLQVANWMELSRSGLPVDAPNLFGFAFYLLTALHAAHVVGGIVPLAMAYWNARSGRTSSRAHHGVVYCAMYWHFLDVVWLVLFVVLMV